MLLNLPHRNIQTLQHPNHEHLPQYLQWYAAASHHFPDLWTNDENLRSILIKQGHRNYYMETGLGHIASMHDLFYLLQIQVISAQQLDTAQIPDSNELTLDHSPFTNNELTLDHSGSNITTTSTDAVNKNCSQIQTMIVNVKRTWMTSSLCQREKREAVTLATQCHLQTLT